MPLDGPFSSPLPKGHGGYPVRTRPLWVGLLIAALICGCAWQPPMAIRGEREADQMVAALRQANAGLKRFQCLGRVTLTDPHRPTQAFRAAIAGQRPERLRIDLIAPYGGIVGTVASDGDHLVLLMRRSGAYRKKRLGDGSLHRFIGVDITVADVLDLMTGRVPIEAGLSAQTMAGEANGGHRLELIDRYGRVHQRITLDASRRPVASVWYDGRAAERFQAALQDWQAVDGFMLPRRVAFSGATGSTATVAVDRFLIDVDFQPSLFAPAPPPDWR